MNDFAPLLADTIQCINETALVVLEAQVDHVRIDALLLEVLSLLLLELFDGDAEVVHGLLETRRVKIEVNSLELTKFTDMRYVVVVLDFGFFGFFFFVTRRPDLGCLL